MSRKEQINTFSDGIITDKHPLTQSNQALTDAVNVTLTTYNGNEMILQNDMGNAKIISEDGTYVKLPDGFEPIGMKEHGGILYIISQNKNTKEFQLGSFPGPNYVAETLEERSYTFQPNFEDFKDFKVVVEENVKSIDDTKLYQVLPMNLLTDNNQEYCILRVGQEFKLNTYTDSKQENNLSNKDSKLFYKLKFVNLDDSNKDITDYVKFAVSYNSDSDFYYFPNIKITSLGVKFELEDIEYFRLGENDLPEYDNLRFPTFDFQTYELTFKKFEYKSESSIKVDSFNIKLTITDKDTGEKLFLIKDSSGKNIISDIPQDLIVELPIQDSDIYNIDGLNWKLKHGNYILDYIIYPRWKKMQLNELDPDYDKVFEKYIIRESIDLTLLPSLWGSVETVDAHPQFELDKVLSGDLERSDTDEKYVSIGIYWKNLSDKIKYDFLEQAKKDPNFMPLKDVKSIGQIKSVFEGLNIYNYVLQRSFIDGYMNGFAPNNLNRLREKLSPMKLGRIAEGTIHNKDITEYKIIPTYEYLHNYSLAKNPIIENTKFYRQFAELDLKVEILTDAQKPSPHYAKSSGVVSPINASHIEVDKTAASPVWQYQVLKFNGYEPNIENIEKRKDSLHQISFPRDSDCLEDTTEIDFNTPAPISMFDYNSYNWNFDEDGGKEQDTDYKYFLESYKQEDVTPKLENIILKDGDLKINIDSKIYYIFGHNWDQGIELKFEEYPNDLNPQDVQHIQSFFENSIICSDENKKLLQANQGEYKSGRRIDTQTVSKVGGKFVGPSSGYIAIRYEVEDPNVFGYYSWNYDITNHTKLKFKNESSSTIQTAFVKARDFEGDFYYFSTNNAYKSNEIVNFEDEVVFGLDKTWYANHRSNYRILKQNFKDNTGSDYPILNPYPIEDSNLYYNFLTIGKTGHYAKFELNNYVVGDIYNISFYVGAFDYDTTNQMLLNLNPNSIFSDYKIFIQDSEIQNNSDGSIIESGFKSIESNNIKLKEKYQLVQIVGKLKQGFTPQLILSSQGNGSATIRNLILFKSKNQTEITPNETCAISVYYNDKTFVDYSKITNKKFDKIWGGGKQYCYLPLPFFQIEDGNDWCYTDDEDGKTKIKGQTYQIV